MPVTAMLLITSYAFARSLEGGLGWAMGTGVLYGLLLDTKHNAWLLPGAFVLHFLVTRGAHALRELRAKRWAVPHAFLAMLLISPGVFYACWPWIWHDTAQRLRDYAQFHFQHEYYNMEFLGQTYWKPPMPRLYAWVMTLATVPGITLLLFGIGLLSCVWRRRPASTPLLWFLCLAMCYAPWWSDQDADLRRHEALVDGLSVLVPICRQRVRLRGAALGGHFSEQVVAARGAPAARRLRVARAAVHDAALGALGLSFYTPLVGGAPGAASLGLNRTFWGYTTGALQGFINQRAPRHGNVYVHDTALQSWEMLRVDGRIRADLRGTLAIPGSALALYHHEPHMRRVEYQTWLDYGHAAPAAVGTFDGVPVVWVYAR